MNISEPFATGKSYLHSLDPKTRVISAFILSVVIALSHEFYALWAGLAVAIILTFTARLNLKIVGRRLTTVAGFLIVIWLMLPITYEGKALFEIWRLKISQPGIMFAARITIRTVSILLIFMSLIATMTVSTLGHTLYRLKIPEKFIYLLLLTYRYLFVIHDEYLKLRTAMKIRGFKPGTNLHTYKSIAYLIGMLFVRASMRAERVSQAMRCRGFKGRFYTIEDEVSDSRQAFLIIPMVFSVALIAFLEWKL